MPDASGAEGSKVKPPGQKPHSWPVFHLPHCPYARSGWREACELLIPFPGASGQILSAFLKRPLDPMKITPAQPALTPFLHTLSLEQMRKIPDKISGDKGARRGHGWFPALGPPAD